MKYAYIEKNFQKSSLELIEQANSIIEAYFDMGYRMTLRQLYYQMVSADLIPNNLKTYKRLASIINDARWSGLVDWDAIEDRGRSTERPSTWGSPRSIMRSVLNSYREDLWLLQPCYIEVMCEKDAVSNIIEPVCNELGVGFTANRGYASASLLKDVADRFIKQGDDMKELHIIYLGDHDASGLDMDRDIAERTRLLLEGEFDIEITRIALLRDQVDLWSLPPNPAKMTDSRAPGYVSEFGRFSWELDAIRANDLADLVREEIELHIDEGFWNEAKAMQEKNLSKLKELTAKL